MPLLSYTLNRVLCFLLTLTLVAACSGHHSSIKSTQNTHSSSSLRSISIHVVKHIMGETQVPIKPQRVVTLDTSYLANALALGVQPIGSTAWLRREHQSGFGPVKSYLLDHTQEISILGYGSNAEQVNLEKILILKPDLIMADQAHKAVYPQLSQIAPTVLYQDPYANDNVSEGWKNFLRVTAEVLGKTQSAEVLLDRYEQRTQVFKQKMGDHLSSIQVSVVNPMPEGIRLIYRDTFCGRVISDAGLSRPLEQDRDGYSSSPLSLELISQVDSDVIFLISFADRDNLKLIDWLKNHPLWSHLKAVKQSKVYWVDAEHWYGSDIIAANLILDDLFKYLVAE